MRLKDRIRYAQALAEFANLKPEQVLDFRRRECEGSAAENPFVPANWFDHHPTGSERKPLDRMQWQINQEMLREAWQKQFQIGQWELMRLLTSVFDPDSLTDVLLGMRQRPAFATIGEMPEEMYPYQQAVMFLMEQNWRARLCERCNTPFVATHNRAKYCSTEWNEDGDTCASLARKATHKRDYRKHRTARNKKRRLEYGKSKDRKAR